MQRALLSIALLLLPCGLGGCTSLALETAEAKLSQLTDSECSYSHVLVGEAYCRERTVARAQEPLYCFNTLGGVDCYAEPDPYKINPSGRSLQATPLARQVSPAASVASATPDTAQASEIGH